MSRNAEPSPAALPPPPPRVVIESVWPEIDAGRFAIKRVLGQSVCVGATIFTEGHDRLDAVVRFRHADDAEWQERAMVSLGPGLDRFEGSFEVERLGRYEYTVLAWVDVFGSWRTGLRKKADAGQSVASELQEGAALVAEAAGRAQGDDRAWLERAARALGATAPEEERIALALDAALAECMARHADRSNATRHPRRLGVQAERERARSGAWYEFFPRSCAPEPGRHGTFRDAEERLRYAADLGFDVVYLPPVHPIGETHRKGPDNSSVAGPGDPGSPWAIGAQEGGHKAVHPLLGSLAEFDHLVATAHELGLEVALDIAYQCSPDHPYVSKHPEWFRKRPDGSIQYAENPPKKYQDIYPLHFESERWQELWEELKSVVLFWVDHGVKIFRVDNPHTKPFAFWEWLIREVREEHPEVVFLSEAFTRPPVLNHLAKVGFSQSYHYFTWRNTRRELESYFRSLAHPEIREVVRPNLFANTPDILHAYLQTGRRSAFQVRLVLAATLGESYGIYGPPFELCVSEAVPGTEEYLGSEKYEVRHWDLDAPGNIRDTVRRVNRIRRENPALTRGEPPIFQHLDNEQLVAFVRRTPELDNVLLVVVNLDPYHRHTGWLELDLEALGLSEPHTFQVEDLLGGARYLWEGARTFVALDPDAMPAHVFRLRRRVRTERDFDYYL